MSRRIDQIRAMNVEELAELLDDIAEDAFNLSADDDHQLQYPCSVEAFAAWLMEEVDE